MRDVIKIGIVAFALALIVGSALALAQPLTVTPAPDSTAESVASELVGAVRSGDYWYAVGPALLLLTLGFRRFVAWRGLPWFSTDRGGVASAGITAALSTAALLLIADRAPSWALVDSVVAATVVAMGGYAGIKRLWRPLPAPRGVR